ncbi:MAG: serine hydrolase domain-containing protein [Myxococcota bacterium]
MSACGAEIEPPDSEGALPRETRFDSAVDSLLEELDGNLAPGVSIAVMEHGEIVWAEGFGSASPLDDVPVEIDTTFMIGSTTKQLTAMAVLTQVDDGLYSLDDTIAELLPEFIVASTSEWTEQTTMRHLLSHQSGLQDAYVITGTGDDAGLASHYYGPYRETAMVMTPPGTLYNYSNPGVDLAGLIVEEHDPQGRRYPDIVNEEIFAPLGMTRSFARVAEAAAAGNYADSIGFDADQVVLGEFPDFQLGEPVPLTIEELQDAAAQRPAGTATFSTPSDMCRWGDFLIHGNEEVVSDHVRAMLTTPEVDTQLSDPMSYGLGIVVWDQFPLSGDPFTSTEYHPITVWEHGGNTLSFTSSLIIVPDHDVVVSILSNGTGSTHAATQSAVLEVVLDELPPPSTYTPDLDPSRFSELAGTYDAAEIGEIAITEGGANGLQISIPSFAERGFEVQPDLIPVSTYVWLSADLGLDFTFIRDEQGELTPWLRTRYFVGKRED